MFLFFVTIFNLNFIIFKESKFIKTNNLAPYTFERIELTILIGVVVILVPTADVDAVVDDGLKKYKYKKKA